MKSRGRYGIEFYAARFASDNRIKKYERKLKWLQERHLITIIAEYVPLDQTGNQLIHRVFFTDLGMLHVFAQGGTDLVPETFVRQAMGRQGEIYDIFSTKENKVSIKWKENHREDKIVYFMERQKHICGDDAEIVPLCLAERWFDVRRNNKGCH